MSIKKVRVTATYEFEIVDELAVRDAGFKARMGNPAFAATYEDQSDDDVMRAVAILFGHKLPKSVDGIAVVRTEVRPEDITNVS
ncbi:hypothetical protein [Rhodococcus sp. USK13]|uniref:hypothetical protein n=1 Tax=Rhodococcus sp. USK13 TaxID=2806442 RepID=UPI001BCAB467|nr:hypothetical protein [Rhodococcus sp. USK13]